MATLKFGRVRYYDPGTRKGLIDIDDGAEQAFDATDEVHAKIAGVVGDAEAWQTLEILRKKPLAVSLLEDQTGPQAVAKKLEFLD